MKHPKITWALVMDAGHAYIAQQPSRIEDFEIIQKFEHDHSSTSSHERDQQGRVFESGVNMRHAYEKKHDWHTLQKEEFAQEMGTFINSSESRFDELIIIAPPKMLGWLREHFSKDVELKIKKELGKEIAQLSHTELKEYLEGLE